MINQKSFSSSFSDELKSRTQIFSLMKSPQSFHESVTTILRITSIQVYSLSLVQSQHVCVEMLHYPDHPVLCPLQHSQVPGAPGHLAGV